MTLTSSRKKISEVLNNRIKPISSKTDKRKQAVKLPIEHELEVADQQAEDEVVKRDMLDAYYRKRLHDIEEKSIKLEKERVKQEKEDLKRMGSVPKNYERSKKLAELYRIRQKLIQDDLFLKRYYDRENSKFELKPNPEYSYKKMSYKQPPLFTMDPNESQSPEKHILKSRTSKTKEVTSYNQKYNKSYKYIASDFHEIHMHNFYDGEKKYLENKESNRNIRKLINMERSHTASDIHKENYPFGRQKSKKKTLIIKEDDSKVGQEEGEENGDSGLKKEPKIKITYDPDEGFIKTKIVQDASPNINDLQDWDLFLQDQKPVSVKEKNQDKKWVKNEIRKSEKKTENGMNNKMSDGGEFFNLVKEDQEYEALSKIPTHRKEKDFLRPEEIKRNNKILMKKSKPIQNLKQ